MPKHLNEKNDKKTFFWDFFFESTQFFCFFSEKVISTSVNSFLYQNITVQQDRTLFFKLLYNCGPWQSMFSHTFCKKYDKRIEQSGSYNIHYETC